jgi:hypothetical protein
MSIRSRFLSWRLNMRGFGSGSFDPKTLAILEAAFDETWLTVKLNGNHKVRAERLHERALAALVPAIAWRDANPGFFAVPNASFAEPEQDAFQPAR